MPNIIYNRRLNAPTGVAYDAATTAWVNAVIGAGGSVSDAQKSRVDTLITSLKTHSLWTGQDRIWLLAAENTQQALLDIVNLGQATEISSPTFTANQGYTGDGSSSYVDTGFSSPTNWTQNSASLTAYIRTSRSTNTNGVAVGRYDSANTGTQDFMLPLSSGSFSYDVNNTIFSNQPANTNIQGLWTASRTGASTIDLYKNSNSTAFHSGSSSSNSLAAGATKFFILARSNNNTAQLFSNDQIAIVAMGAGLSAANTAQFQTDLNAYMTSLGTNVY